MTGKATILRGDARALPLPDNSVDLIVTSPPYWSLRAYTDGGSAYDGQIGAEETPREYIASLVECTREWTRALKPPGSLWVNLGDKYAGAPSGPRKLNEDGWDRDRTHTETRLAGRVAEVPQKSLIGLPWRYAIACVDLLGLTLRAEVIWSKPNGLPESVTDRVRRSHETWFHFTLGPRYYSAVDAIRNPRYVRQPRPNEVNQAPGGGMQGQRNIPGRSDYGKTGSKPRSWNPLGKLPDSVWDVPTEPLQVPDELGVDHFAAFPLVWPRRIIAGWCPEGGTVLDPFGGAGTTALAAKALGRHGISVDMSADYCRLAKWRTGDSAQLAKAMRVEAPRKEIAGQTDLLAALGVPA